MALHLISDAEMYRRIHEGCRAKRQALALSQAALAGRSGLSLRTVKKFEHGESINLMSLMKLLRALGEFQRLEALVPDVEASPREQFLSVAPPQSKRTREKG